VRLGLMGGTFDPVHHGHLVAAEEARYAFELERVMFVPAGHPWQKGRLAAPPEERFSMTLLATQDNPHFEVSRIEIDRDGPTYTVDTLRELRAQRPDDELFFVTGADAVREILTWKDPDEALRLATFVAVTRPGYPLDKLPSRAIEVLEIPALAISSTDIRARVAAGRPIRYLVPDAVAAHIRVHDLYRA
jgi:nicotinate-nucleotide adenylyltransferase